MFNTKALLSHYAPGDNECSESSKSQKIGSIRTSIFLCTIMVANSIHFTILRVKHNMQLTKSSIQIVSKTFLIAILVCLCFENNYAQNKTDYTGNTLPLSTPEAEGVSLAGILKFLDAVDKGKNELHSFVILRHGKIISQGWWSPYGKEL